VEFAASRSALALHLHASADSRNSYAHAAGSHLTGHSNIPSAAAPEPPAVTRQARRSHVVPRLLCSSVSRKPLHPTSRAHTHSKMPPTAVGAPRLPHARAPFVWRSRSSRAPQSR
jgi:hypothetical protein